MKIAQAAVHRPISTTMVFVGLLILGAVSFTRLQIDLLPEIDFPSISVVTAYEGAGPEEIETIITRPIEQALATIQGIERIESFSAEGRSRVSLRFVWGTSLDAALNDVRAVVERVKAGLPEDTDNPIVYKFNLGNFPVLMAGLSGTLSEPALRDLADRELTPRLERIDGVAAATIRGGVKREFHVLLDADRIRAFGITPAAVVDALRAGNRNVPAGQVEQFDNNVLVRTIGEAETARDLLDIVITIRQSADGSPHAIAVRDVADVLDTFEEASALAYINGQPGIRVSINKQSGANTVEVSRRVRAEMERINRDYGGRVVFEVVSDTAQYIEASITNVRSSMLFGALLAVLVLIVALRSVLSTFIIATAIPISIIGIFTLMVYFGITLNLVSFGGLALGVGMLVDNAIVILENIYRKVDTGASPRTAAIEGAHEVTGAIVASTVTTLVVFVPVIFLSGFAAIFFGQMAFVVSFALICSLAVALTLVPVMSSKFLRPATLAKTEHDRVGAWLLRGENLYGRFVDACLRRPKTTVALAIVTLIASLFLYPLIGTELMPQGDEGALSVAVDMPVGTRLEVTDAAVRRIETVIFGSVPELAAIETMIGTPGFWSTAGEESARIGITLVPIAARTRSSEDVANALRTKLGGLVAGAEIRITPGGGLWILRMLRGGGERLEVQVRGRDLTTGDRLAEQVDTLMSGLEGVSGTRISRQPGGREIRLIPDREKLASVGLLYADVARQVQTYVQGAPVTVLRTGGDEYNVIVKLHDDELQGIDAALDVPIVMPNSRATTPLRNLVRVEETEGPLVIERLNQNRVVTISGILTGAADLGSLAAKMREAISHIEVPDTFSVIVTGETAEQEQTFRGLLIGIALAIVLVYMVMASQFESLLQPLLIMCSVPFAAIGVLVALAATRTTFNIQSFMGCIMLVGIVVNNAIVLVDYINLMRREHAMPVLTAVALSARRRLRPIMMTTATTVLALIPVAIGSAEGGEAQAPLARAVIGGLISSTAISLVIIPVLYALTQRDREVGRQ